MTVVHPIARAWITTGGTGAQNYDEFADDAEITAIIAGNPHSALAIEMPHRAPDEPRQVLPRRLPDAVARLAEAKARRQLRAGRAGRGALPDHRAGRAAGVRPVVHGRHRPDLHQRRRAGPGDPQRGRVHREGARAGRARRGARAPAVARPAAADRPRRRPARGARRGHRRGRRAGRDRHRPGRPHPRRSGCCGPARSRTSCSRWPAAASWSSPTATTAAWPRRPAACRASWPWSPRPASVAIQPYNRLVSELTVPPTSCSAALPRPGARVERAAGAAGGAAAKRHRPAVRGAAGPTRSRCRRRRARPRWTTSTTRWSSGCCCATRSASTRATSGSRTSAATTRPAWLRGEVDAGRAELAVLIAPVTVDDFVAVNLARQKMPRKSTWFTPKARGGLVLAQLGA